LEEIFDSLAVTEEEQTMIAHDNACRLYHFDPAKIAFPA
jgi:predicted TIM-barrel fold metal-dependent hydrolase